MHHSAIIHHPQSLKRWRWKGKRMKFRAGSFRPERHLRRLLDGWHLTTCGAHNLQRRVKKCDEWKVRSPSRSPTILARSDSRYKSGLEGNPLVQSCKNQPRQLHYDHDEKIYKVVTPAVASRSESSSLGLSHQRFWCATDDFNKFIFLTVSNVDSFMQENSYYCDTFASFWNEN